MRYGLCVTRSSSDSKQNARAAVRHNLQVRQKAYRALGFSGPTHTSKLLNTISTDVKRKCTLDIRLTPTQGGHNTVVQPLSANTTHPRHFMFMLLACWQCWLVFYLATILPIGHNNATQHSHAHKFQWLHSKHQKHPHKQHIYCILYVHT